MSMVLQRARRAAAWIAGATWVAASIACGGGGGQVADARAAFLGGDTTVFNTSPNAFGFPLANLSAERSDAFFVGNSFFRTNWVTAPSSTTGRDGLGPLLHAVGCSGCHLNDGRAQPPIAPELVAPGLLFKLTIGPGLDGRPLPDPAYGDQLQPAAILGVEPEGYVEVRYTEVPGAYGDGAPYSLRRPVYTPRSLAYGPLDPEARLGPRVAPSVFGLGLLMALEEAQLVARADPLDVDGDGVSGRVQRVPAPDGSVAMLGRFGWKASQPTLLGQSAAAFRNDVGLTSRLFPEQPCAPGQVDCLAAPDGGVPEVGDEVLEPLVFYMHTLAVPGRRSVEDPTVRRGELLFRTLGCAACHVPEATTGDLAGFPELSRQRIRPFTDLLLHDMGLDLADGVADHEATGAEWRTPPLWGLGLQQAVSGHTTLLHDGRARDAAEAILWHGGEGMNSRERFRLLSAADRAALLAFLEDL